jgi:hypothetical protein
MAIASRKACPVVLRRNQDRFEILAFRHPIAGCQLVKGSIEPEEDVGQAAIARVVRRERRLRCGNSFVSRARAR